MSITDPAGRETIRLVALIGSLRAASVTRVVFDAAVELLPAGVELGEHALGDLPLYNGDVEAAGDPVAVVALKAAVEESDGLILFTPEYNRSIPAVTKNAIDWLSRVPGDSPLSRTVTGVVAATPGRHEVQGVRRHLADSLSGISGHFFDTTLGIGSLNRRSTDGHLTDSEARALLEGWLSDFASYVDRHR
ncbi:MAG: NAD(P)H-dependent oxidoreductase [Acidimicrobiia bacterium]|nr:NAD(P)H-dependent oxidoreductase [Acidimicrobiia bacterium]